MAWTAPRTWVDGEDVVASMLNTHLRDNLKAISDPWTTYTPTIGGGWTLGSGTIAGRYTLIGKTVSFQIGWLLGSGTQHASTSPTLSLPFSVASGSYPGGTLLAFPAVLHQPAVIASYGFGETAPGSSGFTLYTNSRTTVTDTAPYNWTSAAIFSISGTYEAA